LKTGITDIIQSATHRPNVTDQGKERAREKLENMGQPEE